MPCEHETYSIIPALIIVDQLLNWSCGTWFFLCRLVLSGVYGDLMLS